MSSPAELQAALRAAVAPFAGRPLVVHSDLFRAGRFVPPLPTRDALLGAHVALLDGLGAELLVPAFNYQFPRTRRTDLRSAPVELGPLGEFMRSRWAGARTLDPVFSFLSREPRPPHAVPDPLVAFGPSTGFAEAAARDGAVLMYGAQLPALTLIHHAELLAGGPPYRYDKDFAGLVTDLAGRDHALTYRYHVRPMGEALDYDWARLEGRLVEAGALRRIVPFRPDLGFVLPVRAFLDVVCAELRRDPLWLLDAGSRAWVEPRLARLGRRFRLGDFE